MVDVIRMYIGLSAIAEIATNSNHYFSGSRGRYVGVFLVADLPQPLASCNLPPPGRSFTCKDV